MTEDYLTVAMADILRNQTLRQHSADSAVVSEVASAKSFLFAESRSNLSSSVANLLNAGSVESLFLTVDQELGSLQAFSLDENIELLVDGELASVGYPSAHRMPTDRINRIADPEFLLPISCWRSEASAECAPVGKNIAPEWTLENGSTLFLSSSDEIAGKPVAANFVCPVQGNAISVVPGQAYTFQAHLGLHRTTGLIRLTFVSAVGAIVAEAEAEVLTTLAGGRKLTGYHRCHLTARAPADADRLRIQIIKGPTAAGEKDSFLFFTKPALTRTSAALEVEHLLNDLPLEVAAKMFSHQCGEFLRARLPVPDRLLDGSKHVVSLRHRSSGDVVSVPVIVPQSLRFEGRMGLDGSTLVGSISSAFPIGICLWIDGDATSVTSFSEAGTGTIRLHIPSHSCDGRPHVFEIRRSSTGQLLAQHACISPASITPWDTLQRYSGSPLPGHLSTLASYRYASLAASRDRVSAGGPSLDALHEILLEGFSRPRKQFKVLKFPEIAVPDVSIVIPVHNKFDVTYVCLAAILFAASKVTCQVIVVDDGSTDTTTRLTEIAPGVTYVRNETALGFVGACNAGAEVARGRYIVLLNNDTEPTAHWLDELIFAFENFEGIGLAGSKLIYPSGELQEAGGIVWGTGDLLNYGRHSNPFDPRYSYSRVCDYVSGAALMIPRELWLEIGGFSKEFSPAYFEDTDLAFKVKSAGKKVIFVPHSIVVHYEGVSNGTDSTTSSGLKRFQEINRPKFKRKWSKLFSNNGKVGMDVDLAKDREVTRRVLFVDYEVPQLDRDAGSYAAIQEMRLFQAIGCKVTFLPLNLAYLGRHTDFLQRLGVETINAPFASGVASFLKARGAEFDVIYITRYGVAEQVTSLAREFAPQAKIIVNLADLHFLRQIRDALVTGDENVMESALKTREAEIAALSRVDLVLTYSSVEESVVSSHVPRGPKTGILPWVVDSRPLKSAFNDRRDITFIGGFNHSPNVNAVKYFITEVMPLLRITLPGVRFLIYGSNIPADIEARANDDIVIKGYVADIADVFDSCRVFVAPLLTGAGVKGKVLDCIAAGVPSVLSPVAAEGIGIRDGMDAMIARKPQDWVDAIVRLYGDEATWSAMSRNAHELARGMYSFESGVVALRDALEKIDFTGSDGGGLCATSARPASPRHMPMPLEGHTVSAVTETFKKADS